MLPAITTVEPGPGQDAVRALLERTRAQHGGGLLVHGAPGIGKSTLLRQASEAADGFLGLAAAGVEAESALPLGTLHTLLMPLMTRISALPRRLATTLTRAFNSDPDDVPADLPLRVAVLELLVRTARRRPVLCCVDDIQYVDLASLEVLAFVARRLDATRIAMLLAAPDDRPPAGWLPGVATLSLSGLPAAAGAALVEQVVSRHTKAGIANGIALSVSVACAGNPRAIEELALALAAEQRQGHAPLPEVLPLHSAVRRAYDERVAGLPDATRRLLVLVAASESPEVETIGRAAEAAGDNLLSLRSAEAAGLVHEVDGMIRFRMPLLGGAIYQGVPPADRQAAHRSLAAAFDRPGATSRLRRAWHMAALSDAPEQALVDELERAAAAVRDDGDHVAASLAAERIAELTPQLEARAGHLLTAARDAWLAGRPERAGMLLTRVRPPRPALRDFADLLRGEIEMRTGTPAAGEEILLAAAGRLAEPHRTAAMIALIHASEANFLSGDQERYVDVLRRVLALRRSEETPDAEFMFEFCAGMAATFSRRQADAIAPLRHVLELAPQHDDPTLLIWASVAGCVLGQETAALSLSVRARNSALSRGEITLLPRTYALSTYAEHWLGRYANAATSAEEGLRLALEVGQNAQASFHLAALALLAVPHGDEQTCELRAKAAIAHADNRGLSMPVAMANWALGALDLTFGRTAEAASRLRVLVAGGGRSHPLVRMMATPHFVEAALRCGDRAGAEAAVLYFDAWATQAGSPGPTALAARCRAMIATDPAVAEENYQEALRLHLLGDAEFERARTELLYGHQLRRQRGSLAARGVLHSALETFQRLAARPWIDQCQNELRAAGEVVRPASGPAPGQLTPQQTQIAQLAAQGATNREIAAQLYLSIRTVDHHMRNIFVRLGVRSRLELVRLVS